MICIDVFILASLFAMSIFFYNFFAPRTQEPFSHSTSNLSQQNSTKPTSTPLANLPPEIVLLIAQHLSKRRDTQPSNARRVSVARSDLSSLASTSTTLRSLLLPLMFSDIKVSSAARLLSLAKAPVLILTLIRHFTVLIDLEFYDTWMHALEQLKTTSLNHDHHVSSQHAVKHSPNGVASTSSRTLPELRRNSDSTISLHSHHDSTAPLHALSTILLRAAPTLRSFGFLMHSQPGSTGSAWSQFPKSSMSGIPFVKPLVTCLQGEWLELQSSTYHDLELGEADDEAVEVLLADDLSFPLLTSLTIDGTPEISPLFHLTPNLAKVRLRIPEGFTPRDSRMIVDSLKYAPNLTHLEMWIRGLDDDAEERVFTLGNIGEYCPQLEVLNFQTRSYDYADGTLSLRPAPGKAFNWRDFLSVIHLFPKLQELHLPGTLPEELEQDDIAGPLSTTLPSPTDLSRFVAHAPGMNYPGSTVSPTLESLLPQQSSISGSGSSPPTIVEREIASSALLIDTSLQLGGALSRVSWVRPESKEPTEYEAVPSSILGKSAVQLSTRLASRTTSLEYQSFPPDSDFYDSFCHDFYDIDVKSTSSTSLVSSVSIFFTSCILSACSSFLSPNSSASSFISSAATRKGNKSIVGSSNSLTTLEDFPSHLCGSPWRAIRSLTGQCLTLTLLTSAPSTLHVSLKFNVNFIDRAIWCSSELDPSIAIHFGTYAMFTTLIMLLACLLASLCLLLLLSRGCVSRGFPLHG